MDWKDLENEVKELLDFDSPVIPPNSGGTKKEEDVVGNTIIAQCKSTQNKNISILNNDVERLLKSSEIQNKFPVFITKNKNGTYITIKVDNNSKNILRYISYIGYISQLTEMMYLRSTNEIIRIMNKCLKKLKDCYFSLMCDHKLKIDKITQNINSKYDNVYMINMFED